ncbi:hypothetical protein T261_8305 [Streptomyces lydicus]|nr:hypothetical protein T261_8305 [Streptomyces lydicus]
MGTQARGLGRDAAELTALADLLSAHGLALEMLAGPLPGMYDPSEPWRLLFAFCAAMAETKWEIREYGRVVRMGGVGMLGGPDLALPYPWIMRSSITVRNQWTYPRGGRPARATGPLRRPQ